MGDLWDGMLTDRGKELLVPAPAAAASPVVAASPAVEEVVVVAADITLDSILNDSKLDRDMACKSQPFMKTPPLAVERAMHVDQSGMDTEMTSSRRLLSWRPRGHVTGSGIQSTRKRKHSDPRNVEQGLVGYALMAALNQPVQLKHMLSQNASDINERDADGDRVALHCTGAIQPHPA